jgi:hypothetical protein
MGWKDDLDLAFRCDAGASLLDAHPMRETQYDPSQPYLVASKRRGSIFIAIGDKTQTKSQTLGTIQV